MVRLNNRNRRETADILYSIKSHIYRQSYAVTKSLFVLESVILRISSPSTYIKRVSPIQLLQPDWPHTK